MPHKIPAKNKKYGVVCSCNNRLDNVKPKKMLSSPIIQNFQNKENAIATFCYYLDGFLVNCCIVFIKSFSIVYLTLCYKIIHYLSLCIIAATSLIISECFVQTMTKRTNFETEKQLP